MSSYTILRPWEELEARYPFIISRIRQSRIPKSVSMAVRYVELQDLDLSLLTPRNVSRTERKASPGAVVEYINVDYNGNKQFNLLVDSAILSQNLKTGEHDKMRLTFELEDDAMVRKLTDLGEYYTGFDLDKYIGHLDANGESGVEKYECQPFWFVMAGKQTFSANVRTKGGNPCKVWDGTKGPKPEDEKAVPPANWEKQLKLGAMARILCQPSIYINHETHKWGWTLSPDTIKITAPAGTARSATKVRRHWHDIKKQCIYEWRLSHLVFNLNRSRADR